MIGKKKQRILLSAFILLNLVVIGAVSIPADFFLVTIFHAQGLLTGISEKSATYASIAGLRLSWSMFAPNPSRDNSYIDAEISYRDGRKHIWSFPQMQELGYAERYAKERYRKFATENLWPKKNAGLWPSVALYIARLNADRSEPPQTVKLVHYWSEIPSISLAGETPPPEHWQRDVFFVYTVRPGDLR